MMNGKDRLKVLGSIFKGKDVQLNKFEILYGDLKKIYDQQVLPAVNKTAYLDVSGFIGKLDNTLEKLKLLVTWPELVGKTVIGVQCESNGYCESFKGFISNGRVIYDLPCPILLNKSDEQICIKSKFTGKIYSSEDNLKRISELEQEKHVFGDLLDVVVVPMSRFDNVVFVLFPSGYNKDFFPWNVYVSKWVFFSVDQKVQTFVDDHPCNQFLILHSKSIKFKHRKNCEVSYSIGNMNLEKWLFKHSQKVWRNVYYNEFYSYILDVEVYLRNLNVKYQQLVKQSNEDRFIGNKIDPDMYKDINDIIDAQQKNLEEYQKAYREFLNKLEELKKVIVETFHIESDKISETEKNLLWDVAMKLAQTEDKLYQDYYCVLKAKDNEKFFLLDLWHSDAPENDGIVDWEKIHKLVALKEDNLWIKRCKVKYREQLQLSQMQVTDLLLGYETEITNFTLAELEILGEYYSKSFEKDEHTKGVKYLWRAFNEGSQIVGEKLLSYCESKEEKQWLATAGVKSAMSDVMNNGLTDQEKKFFLKIQAAQGNFVAIYEIFKNEVEKIPSLDSLEIVQNYVNGSSFSEENIQELIGMLKDVKENCHKLSDNIGNDAISEWMGMLHLLLCYSSETNFNNARIVRSMEDGLKKSHTARSYYWLGNLSLRDASPEKSSGKTYYNKALDYYKLAKKEGFTGQDLDLQINSAKSSLRRWKKKFNPPPPPSESYTEESSSCVPEWATVILATGEILAIEKIKLGDRVLSFNHFSGKIEPAVVFAVVNHDLRCDICGVITLIFSDGTETSFIKAHCYFDVTLNRYVEISATNVNKFIKHEFLKVCNGQLKKVTLIDVLENKTNTRVYEIITENNLNFIVDGMLSASMYLAKFLNIFNFIQESAQYDLEKIKKLVDQYGLAKAEEFPVIDQNCFEIGNGKFFRAAIATGKLNYKDIDEIAGLAKCFLKQ